MGTLRSKKMDYVPTTENVKDLEIKKIIDDLITTITAMRRDVHDDFRDHEDRLIALEP